MNQPQSTVSVVGAGHVGSAVANALVLLRACDRVVLYDRDRALAEGDAWDIADTVPLLSEMEVTAAAGYADLGGSDVGFAVPGLGVFVPPNLTPDNETGLGNWTAEQIVTAFTKSRRPDGRVLSPAMPTQGFAHLSRLDALAVAAYLKSLEPVKNAVPGPFGPSQKIDVPVMILLPAAVYNRLLEER